MADAKIQESESKRIEIVNLNKALENAKVEISNLNQTVQALKSVCYHF